MQPKPASSRGRLALIATFLVAFVVLLNATTYALYRRARSHLDNELGERLRAVATGVATTVRFAGADTLTGLSLDTDLYATLLAIQDDNRLSNVALLTPGGETLVDLSGFTSPGEPNPFIDLDFGAFTLARAGIASYTELYRNGDVYMKSAYAPVESADGSVVAIVGLEAGASFFTELRELRSLIVTISLGSLVVVLVLGILFYRQSRTLDRAQETLLRRENLASMGRMVANIAHEIRNPLSIIRTSADRLRRKYAIDDETVDYIVEEVDDLDRILTGYLEFAGSSNPASHTPQSARRIVSRSLVVASAEADGRGVRLRDRLPESDVSVTGDERRLRQALINVLLNAIQASEAGGTVDVSLDADGAVVRIIVQDSGAGIDAKDLEEIRKPFFTRRTDGSGLGLHIVQTVVDEHGGTLDIDSEPGRGTRVAMTFPRSPE